MTALPGSIPLALPSAARLLEGVLALGREIHLGMDRQTLAARFLATLVDLFPGRRIAIRLVNPSHFVATPGAA